MNNETKKQDASEVIAAEIETISTGIKRLLGSHLNERAIVTLIYDACPNDSWNRKVSKSAIKDVLQTASNLKDFYLKKKKELEKA